MAKDLRLDVVTTSDGKGLIEVAAEADAAAKEVDKLGRQMKETAVDGGILAAELEATKEQLKSLGKEFDYSGDQKLLKQVSSTRRYSAQLEKLKKDMEDAGKTAEKEGPKIGGEFANSVEQGMRAGLSAGGSAGGGGGMLGPAIVGVLTSPGTLGILAEAGAVMGGVILTGIGLAGIGTGIALSINSGPVHSAILQLKQDVGQGLASASSSFIGPTQRAVQAIDTEFARLQPGIKRVFDSISPELDSLSAGFMGLIDQAAPAIGRAIVAAKPLLDVLAANLPDIGRAIASVFDAISNNSGVAASGLQGLIYLLEDIFHLIGSTINGLSTMYRNMENIALGVAMAAQRMVVFGIAMANAFHLPHDTLDALLPKVQGLVAELEQNRAQADGASASMGALAAKVLTTASNVDRLATELQNFNTQLAAMDGLLSRAQALDQLTIGMAAFKDQLKQTKAAFNANTVAGAQNRDAYIGLIKNAEEYRKSLIDSGVTQAAADKKFQDMIKKINDTAAAAGWSASQIAALDKQLGILPTLKKITIDVTTVFRTIGQPNLRIGKSVPTFADGGDFGPGPMVVGEEGPELLYSQGHGTVVPLKGGGSAGRPAGMSSGSPTHLVLHVRGDELARQILAALRPEIRGVYGGSVEAALAGQG